VDARSKNWLTDGVGVAGALLFLVAVLLSIGLFAWWAFSWSTHTLVWFIFIFGSLLGSVKVRTK
jgi:hypothetical protein